MSDKKNPPPGKVHIKPMTDEELKTLLRYMGEENDDGIDAFFEDLLVKDAIMEEYYLQDPFPPRPEPTPQALAPPKPLPKPHEIMEQLNEYIIDQDDAKKVLSVAIYNHMKRAKDPENIYLRKSNIMLIGSTGTGKTLFAQTIAKAVDIPLAIADATSLTEAGYVGDDVETILERLLDECDHNVKKAERGIIYIDEIDKVCARADSSGKRDISGAGVQHALLKLIEGTISTVKIGSGHNQTKVKVDTSNILFIVGGAFSGIDKIASARINGTGNSIGFGADLSSVDEDKQTPMSDTTLEDLKSYGMIPELLGRIPVLAKLNPLDVDALKRILTEPKNAIVKHYEELFALDGTSLNLSDEALTKIAEEAIENGTGARGLQSIMERDLLDYMFEAEENIEIDL
jgi:ATP-dependent Clp protease ATP-binding subunit ClpX